MIKIIRTNSEHRDFAKLIIKLDAYLKVTDGDEHEFYNQYNGIDALKNVIIAYLDDKPIGCGAFKKFSNSSVEIKRMFTIKASRNTGAGSKILKALEDWASELNYSSCILETGTRQKEAVQFYKKNNYKIIPNYGQYKAMENSLCFKKEI